MRYALPDLQLEADPPTMSTPAPSLPTTLTVEALKCLKLVVEFGYKNTPLSNSAHIALLDDLDSWIAELSPMEEPPFKAIVETNAYSTYRRVLFGANQPHRWQVVGRAGYYTWQEILAIDPRPQIIYPPKAGE
jgi:hypothetical protein